ncbi:hypothetical protein CLCAR_2814 [Clostridium carboxidivorans P7]|nr:hypothetical protein CLCAR_2814 [Clostridium carboxidivorans P7]
MFQAFLAINIVKVYHIINKKVKINLWFSINIIIGGIDNEVIF